MGCDGQTICGNRPEKPDSSLTYFANFQFEWTGSSFVAKRIGRKELETNFQNYTGGRGCGNKITWNDMAPVPLPTEFTLSDPTATVSVEDVELIPQDHAQTWRDTFREATAATIGVMKSSLSYIWPFGVSKE